VHSTGRLGNLATKPLGDHWASLEKAELRRPICDRFAGSSARVVLLLACPLGPAGSQAAAASQWAALLAANPVEAPKAKGQPKGESAACKASWSLAQVVRLALVFWLSGGCFSALLLPLLLLLLLLAPKWRPNANERPKKSTLFGHSSARGRRPLARFLHLEATCKKATCELLAPTGQLAGCPV